MTIGYVMSRFPKLSETFILREMSEVVAQGVPVQVLPLIPNSDVTVVHEEARSFQAAMRPIQVNSRESLAAWGRLTTRRPRLAARLLATTTRGYLGRPGELARALPVLPAGALLAERVTELGLTHLHAHFATYPALAAWVAHHINGVPYSVTVHAHDLYTTQCLLPQKMRDAETVVAISEFNREFLLEHVGPDLGPAIRVIHCGIRAHEYPAVPQRQEPVSPQAPLRITCVGSLEPYKGQVFLLRAARLLADRGLPVRITLIGAGPDRPALEAEASELGLTGQVEFFGGATQDQVREVLARTDVYAQPSIVMNNGRMEGIPVALMEAMASELPVVTTRTSGIPELVRDQPDGTGWLVPPEDAAALAEALETVAEDPVQAARRAAAGRELVRREFELQTVVKQLLPALE